MATPPAFAAEPIPESSSEQPEAAQASGALAMFQDWVLRPGTAEDLPGALILHGRRDRRAEFLCRAAREVRIAQQFARHDDEVGVAVVEDLLRLLRLGDQADCAGCDLRFATDARGERNLVAGRDRDL